MNARHVGTRTRSQKEPLGLRAGRPGRPPRTANVRLEPMSGWPQRPRPGAGVQRRGCTGPRQVSSVRSRPGRSRRGRIRRSRPSVPRRTGTRARHPPRDSLTSAAHRLPGSLPRAGTAAPARGAARRRRDRAVRSDVQRPRGERFPVSAAGRFRSPSISSPRSAGTKPWCPTASFVLRTLQRRRRRVAATLCKQRPLNVASTTKRVRPGTQR